MKIGGAIVRNAWRNILVMQHLLLAIKRFIMILRARFLGSKFIPDQDIEAFCFNVILSHFYFSYFFRY